MSTWLVIVIIALFFLVILPPYFLVCYKIGTEVATHVLAFLVACVTWTLGEGGFLSEYNKATSYFPKMTPFWVPLCQRAVAFEKGLLARGKKLIKSCLK